MATTNSIVDYLKSTGQDSSYGARTNLAKQYGINNYTGSAQQNLQLLSTLRSGSNQSPSQPQQQEQPVPVQQPQQYQQPQPSPQPSLTVSSSDLVNRPIVSSQSTSYKPPQLPTYSAPAAPSYTPPQQVKLPDLPNLQQINLGAAPKIQSTDELLKEVQNKIQPLGQQEIQNIQQGVQAGFAPQFADQQRANDTRNLFEKAAAAQRGDLGFGTSELTYTGLANVQQSGVDALGRLRAAQAAEENTRIQAANEGNRAKQIELFNMANQLRDQQQKEYQTYIQNQVTANDMALQDYKLRLDNTRFENENARQQAMDQFEAAKYQVDLQRQQYQDQLQAYDIQRNQAKDTLAMISELGPNDMQDLGDLSSLETSIGLPPGYVNALRQTKLSAQTAKNEAQIADTYNQGVQLAMSLPEGQSFSLKNPDGSTTTFSGTKPNEFQVVNNAQGVWRVNKDTGEITELQNFSNSTQKSSNTSQYQNIVSPVDFSQTSNNQVGPLMQPTTPQGPSLSGRIGALLGSKSSINQSIQTTQPSKPNIDISKFDPQIQLIINGQTTFDKLPAKERTRLASQYNQAFGMNLLPGQSQSQAQTTQQKPLSGDAAKLKGIVETLPSEAKQLQAAFESDYKGSLKGILTGTDRRLVKLLDQVADKVGRLRSGGAVNDTEAARFKKQIASSPDLLFGNSQDAIDAINGIINEANITAQSISPGSSSGGSSVESLRNKYNY